jgi:hypothetical protein
VLAELTHLPTAMPLLLNPIELDRGELTTEVERF